MHFTRPPSAWSFSILKARILSVNRGMTEITQYSPEELRGQPATFILDDEHKEEIAFLLGRVIRGEIASYRAERRCLRKDGLFIWVRSSVSMMKPGGGPGHIVALCEDITDQKQAREKLRHQALHDPLTGLPNRRHFEQALNAAIEGAARRR